MMASGLFSAALRPLTKPFTALRTSIRLFSTSSQLLSTAEAAVAPKRPLGAFRGGIFGFLTGSLVAGTTSYYYLLKEYKLSNEMLTEDIYALQAATQRLNSYIAELEVKLDNMPRKK